MATVVLLGCSTSGKTSAGKRVLKTYKENFHVVDTDAVVAADAEFRGHLYAMYLKFVRGEDLSAAQLYLEIGERYLLRQLKEQRDSILVSAGPNIPLREPEWSIFLESVKPICFYFRLTAKELYEGLKIRRNRQKHRGLDLCAGFGCWDKDLATRFDPESQEWKELSQEEALPLIEQHLARVEPIYLSSCEPQHVFDVGMIKQDPEFQERITTMIFDSLKWQPLIVPLVSDVVTVF